MKKTCVPIRVQYFFSKNKRRKKVEKNKDFAV